MLKTILALTIITFSGDLYSTCYCMIWKNPGICGNSGPGVSLEDRNVPGMTETQCNAVGSSTSCYGTWRVRNCTWSR